MRICALSLPDLRVELVRLGEGTAALAGSPLAIVVASPPLTEAKLLGNTRLDVVSPEALAHGVRPGHTIAQARAKIGALAVRVVRPDAVRDVLARLAEVALAFGATVSFHAAGTEPTSKTTAVKEGAPAFGDVVWVDVTGCAHLHAPDQATGEARLAARLVHLVSGLGHRCAAAIADGPRVAALLAHAQAQAAADPRSKAYVTPSVVVVPPGRNRETLAPLPAALLPLPDADVRWLAKLGVHTIAELAALPRSALATRLGPRARVVIGLAEGEDRAPLAGYVPPEVPEEATMLEYGIDGTSALLFVAKMLADRLGTRLAGRAVATARLELDLALDGAMVPDGAARTELLAADLPVPLSSASDLLAALRPKIEQHTLRAPVLGAKLRAAQLVHKPAAALSLFDPQPRAARALPRLVAELAGDLGPGAVGRIALGDGWAPEDRSLFVPFVVPHDGASASSAPARSRKRRHLLSSVPEPTRVLAEPRLVPRDAIKIVRHLTRLEAVAWWKCLPGAAARGANGARGRKGVDHVQAWTEDGPAWVEIDRTTGATHIRGWFD
jgi:protein ImuB